MPESFLVLFNSQGSNVIDNTNKNKVIYEVDWEAFLPKKFKKFHCQFVFKSANTGTQLTSNGFVNMNLGKMNTSDGNSQTSNLGIIYPAACGSQYYYCSTNNDNNDFWISYPTNRQVTINLIQFDGTAFYAAAAPNLHYSLFLSLTGIPDEDIK